MNTLTDSHLLALVVGVVFYVCGLLTVSYWPRRQAPVNTPTPAPAGRTWRGKYVVVLHPVLGIEVPVLLAECLPHDSVMRSRAEVVSAGFCALSPEGVACWGESVGLGKRSRGAPDVELFDMWLGYGLGGRIAVRNEQLAKEAVR